MKLSIVIALGLFGWPAGASSLELNRQAISKQKSQTVVVSTPFRQFTIAHGKNQVLFKESGLDLNLLRKKCNAHIIDRFNKEIRQFIQEQVKKNILKQAKFTKKQKTAKNKINSIEPNILVQINGKKYFISATEQAGIMFLSLPREMQKMQWEEKFNCEKNVYSGANEKKYLKSLLKKK